MQEQKNANPAVLGLAAFGLTTVMLNVINSGIVTSDAMGMILPMGLFFGGLGQLIAGSWESKIGNTFGATAFTAYGGFWLALATMLLLESNGYINVVPDAGLALFLAGWGVFTLYMTIPTLKMPRALFVVFATLTILFFMLAIGVYSPGIHKLAGFEGILCGGSALYLSAAQVINETYEREVLPVG